MYLSTTGMQELNAPVASLLTTPNWEVLLTLLSNKRLCRGIWIDWSTGQPPMAWNLTRTRAGFCTWDRVTRDTSVNLESRPAERALGCWWAAAPQEPAAGSGSPEGKPHPGGIKHSPATPSRGDCPAGHSLVQPPFECWAQGWAPPFQKAVKVRECLQSRATELVEGLEAVAEGSGSVRFGEKEAEGQPHCPLWLPKKGTWRVGC